MSFQNPVFIPGPTNMPEAVRQACYMPTIDHRSPTFGKILHPCLDGVRTVLKSETAHIFIFPSTGTGGWETALSNTLSKGDKVLAACKKNNVGTTAMKTAPGSMKMDPFDPENPSEGYAKYIKRQVEKGEKREDVIEEIQGYLRDQIAATEKAYAAAKPFMEEHGVADKKGLAMAAVQWVLSNPDMHTVCITLEVFDDIDRYLPLSGTTTTRAQMLALDRYRVAASSLYCRHACDDCSGACPKGVPVSTVMRYAYYFTEQAREKHAMSKYRDLGFGDEPPCESCSGPCAGACPFGVNVKANLLAAHGLLTLA